MFDKVKFKDLLEIAMNNLSATEFANQSDVNRTYISKLLNLKLDSAPSPDIIKKISSKAKNGVTYEQLMIAAGHINNISESNSNDPFSNEVIEMLGRVKDETDKKTILELIKTYVNMKNY